MFWPFRRKPKELPPAPEALPPGEVEPIPSIPVLTIDRWEGEEIEVGDLITAVTVRAANAIYDVKEQLRNLIGGRMTSYEAMLEQGMEEALALLRRKAHRLGYDAVIGFRIAHPTVVVGGAEIIAYATGVRRKKRPPVSAPPPASVPALDASAPLGSEATPSPLP